LSKSVTVCFKRQIILVWIELLCYDVWIHKALTGCWAHTSIGCLGLFPRGWSGKCVKLITHSPVRTLGSWIRISLNVWMFVCVCIYYVFVLFCVQASALRRADPPFKEFYQLYIGLRNWKKRPISKGIYSHRERKKKASSYLFISKI
jgi:hypothetical protein